MENASKTAVVTGISSGIGLALVQQLLAEHYVVVGTTRSGELPGFAHPRLHVVALEATDGPSRAQAAARIRALLTAAGPDLLVNNAGIAPDVFAVEPNYATFTQTLDTNVTGVVFFTELLLPVLRAGKSCSCPATWVCRATPPPTGPATASLRPLSICTPPCWPRAWPTGTSG
jgi:NAD(P)-dependent dehydrogenase (short-subunit alcohol dehydrogenase family)